MKKLSDEIKKSKELESKYQKKKSRLIEIHQEFQKQIKQGNNNLTSLLKENKKVTEEIENLKKEKKNANEQIEEGEKRLVELKSKFDREIEDIERKNRIVKESLKATRIELEKTSSLSYSNEQRLNQWTQTIDNNLEKIDSINGDINNLYHEVDVLRDDVSENEYWIGVTKIKVKEQEGKIEENKKGLDEITPKVNRNSNIIVRYFKNINEHFGGLTSQYGLGDKDYMMGGVEYEGYNFNNQSSLFGRVSFGHLNSETSYETLVGVDKQQIADDKDIYALEVGYKQLLNYKKFSLQPYGTLSTGYMFGDEETLLGTVSLGLEHHFKSDKASIEVGYRYFDALSQREVLFNPLGQSQNEIDDSRDSMSFIEIKYLWRW